MLRRKRLQKHTNQLLLICIWGYRKEAYTVFQALDVSKNTKLDKQESLFLLPWLGLFPYPYIKESCKIKFDEFDGFSGSPIKIFKARGLKTF